ncbi:MAG: hypothetical protein KDB48_06820 [Solirubrobacterales bacterium]|nr:hypothetical protein [Solirubrobacterales bacterium]HMT06260.1 choice-of-anchor Q domain-containing protein [Solirubrobacterales bacterium]
MSFLLTPSTDSRAAGIKVTTTSDLPASATNGGCGLRQAIQAAQTNQSAGGCHPGQGADKVLLSPGNYRLSIPGAGEDNNATGDLDIWSNEGLTVAAGNPRRATTITGNGEDRVLHVLRDARLTLTGLAVTGGRITDRGINQFESGAGIAVEGDQVLVTDQPLPEGSYSHQGQLRIDRVSVFGNTSDFFGGGIFTGGDLTATNSTVAGNHAKAGGGGIAVTAFGNLSGTNLTVSANSSEAGSGGVHVDEYPLRHYMPPAGMAVFTDSILAGNKGVTPDCFALFGFRYPIELNRVLLSSAQDMAKCQATEESSTTRVGWTGLSPLALKSGARVMTPLPGSPAVLKAPSRSCLSTDQLARRRGNRCDLGATRYQGPFPFTTLKLKTTRTANSPGTTTVKAKVTLAGPGRAFNTRICLTAKTIRSFKPAGKRCHNLGTTKPGTPETVTYTLEPRPGSKTARATLKLTATNYRTRTSAVRIR